MSARQPVWAGTTRSLTLPCAVNFSALDSRFFRICCRRLESVTMLRLRWGSIWTSNDRSATRPGGGTVAPRSRARWRRRSPRVDGDRARFDLGEIEDVADQVQKVGAGAVDGARELDLFGRQVASGLSASCWPRIRIEFSGRAQLVAHVGQELRLVARGQRQLRRLLFDARRACSISWFLRSTSSCGRRAGLLLLELLVALPARLVLLGLQLAGELLRLLEQVLGLHGGFDRIQHEPIEAVSCSRKRSAAR